MVLSREPPIEPATTFMYNDHKYQLNAATLEKLCVLGRGAHGLVQKMRHVPSTAVMAVKVTFTFLLTRSVRNCSTDFLFFGRMYK